MPPTSVAVRLPRVLDPAHDGLAQALAVPLPETWDKNNLPYCDALQPQAIADALVRSIHQHLANWRIGCVFRETLAEQAGKVHLAHASKVGAKLQHFSDLDFLIEVNWSAWLELTDEQRVALIDHELCHMGTKETDEGDRPVLLPHDVQEFTAIVKRWGLWTDELAHFAKAVRQADLFEAGPAA